MLSMVEKVIRRGIYQSIYQYPKANDKHMKDYDKNKELSYLEHWDIYTIWLGNVTKASSK